MPSSAFHGPATSNFGKRPLALVLECRKADIIKCILLTRPHGVDLPVPVLSRSHARHGSFQILKRLFSEKANTMPHLTPSRLQRLRPNGHHQCRFLVPVAEPISGALSNSILDLLSFDTRASDLKLESKGFP